MIIVLQSALETVNMESDINTRAERDEEDERKSKKREKEKSHHESDRRDLISRLR